MVSPDSAPGAPSAVRIVEYEPFDFRGLAPIKPCPQFDDISIRVADKNRHMAIAERNWPLCNPDSHFLDAGNRAGHVVNTEGDMGKSGMLFRHIHQYVLAAGLIGAIDDEVEFNARRVLYDHDRIEIDLVFDFKAESRVEIDSARLVGHPNAEVIYGNDMNHLRELPSGHFACLSRKMPGMIPLR